MFSPKSVNDAVISEKMFTLITTFVQIVSMYFSIGQPSILLVVIVILLT